MITTATASATIICTTNGSIPSLINGFVYGGPLTINRTTVIRAAAFKNGFQPSGVDTQTYLFLNDAIRQSPNGETPPGWPSTWGANVVDYAMDPDVVNNPAYSGAISNGLRVIPSYSIVTELGNLFDPVTGIYANPSQDGIDWERPASIELYADGRGFQVNGGIRLPGRVQPQYPFNPKHAFRLLFGRIWRAKLNYPAFANRVVQSFDGRSPHVSKLLVGFQGDYRFIACRSVLPRHPDCPRPAS